MKYLHKCLLGKAMWTSIGALCLTSISHSSVLGYTGGAFDLTNQNQQTSRYAYQVVADGTGSRTQYSYEVSSLSEQQSFADSNGNVVFDSEISSTHGLVGSRSSIYTTDVAEKPGFSSPYDAKSSTYTEQVYQVTAAGSVTLDWDLEGSIYFAEHLLGDSEADNFRAGYEFTARLNPVRSTQASSATDFDPAGFASTDVKGGSEDYFFNHGPRQPNGTNTIIDESGSLTFDFDESLIGKYFSLLVGIETYVWSTQWENQVDTESPGQLLVEANFLDTGTARLSGTGITSVPLPIPAWFLASGLLSIISWRRWKKNV